MLLLLVNKKSFIYDRLFEKDSERERESEREFFNLKKVK